MTPDDGRDVDVDVDPDVLDRVATLVVTTPGARPIEIVAGRLPTTPGLLALVEDLQERRADGVDDPDELADIAISRLRRAVEDDSPDVNPGGSDDKGGSARADDRDEGPGDDAGDEGEGEGPTYQDLYFDAVDRADRDPGQLVPEPAIREAFASAGHAGVVDHLGGLADWIVWTPDGADETLYLYTPDLAGDTSAERARVAELLRAAGAGTERFIDCHDGHKGSFDTGNDRAPDDPEISGNYGIKGGTGADADADGLHLVDIDVDDYDEGKAANERVDDLREETLAVASAHTPLDRPGHQFVLVDGDPRAVVRDVLGRDVENPAASFGEIRVANQYVVGPGSEIICPCDRCTGDDADERGYGRYEIANEAPPVVWTEAEFEAFLRADPAIDEAGRDADDLASDGATGDLDRDGAGDGGGSGSGGSATGTLSDAVDARLSVGRAVDEYLVEAIRAARAPDDRSAADASLARRVAPWVNNDRDAIAEVLDRHGTEKWATRTDESYRSSVLEYATDRGTAYDPLPFWALREYALAEGVVDEDDLVRRTSDGGDVVDEGGGDGEGDGDGEDPEGGSGTYLGFLNAGAYNAALDAVEDAGVSHGRERADDGGGELEPVGALALERFRDRDLDEARRLAKRRGLDWPSTAAVERRIRADVEEVLADEDAAVVQAPTASNKTGVAAETRWRDVDEAITGGRPVVMFCETLDARDEAIERARDAGLDFWAFRGRKEICDVCAGAYDPGGDVADADDPDAPNPLRLDGDPISEWIDERCDRRGIPVSYVHTRAEERARRQGRVLPCSADEQVCGTKTQWPNDGLADDDGARFDLVIATDPFAYVPSLRQETNVIHDEQPDYTEDFGLGGRADRPDDGADADAGGGGGEGDRGGGPSGAEAIDARARAAVTAFLGQSDVDGAPDTFEALVELARRCARCDAAYWNEQAPPAERPDDDLADRWSATFDALEHEPDKTWYMTDPRAHAIAPALARAIWKAIAGSPDGVDRRDADPDERGAGIFDRNGRAAATVSHSPPRLDDDAGDGAGWNRTHVTVVLDDENTIRCVRNAPDFGTARAVVGLDARPTGWLWQRNVAPEMDVRRVLDPGEARRWRRFERGQTVVQAGDATRPAGRDGAYFNPRHARAIVERLRAVGGDDFRAAGCPKAIADDLADAMRAAGVPDDDVELLTYGMERSNNDLADEILGLVYQCIDPGDGYVLDYIAECGLDAEPARSDALCDDCDGDGCYACDGIGHKRAHGRDWVGPDAEHAGALLDSVRGMRVAQMVGRFGRDLDVDAGETNITVVATDAVPDDLVDYRVPGVEWVATDLQAAIVDELECRGTATTAEIADAVDCSKPHVRSTLERHDERDDSPVTSAPGAGRYGADVWTAGGPVGAGGPGSGAGDDDEAIEVDDVQLGLDEIANDPVCSSSTWSLAIVPVAEAPAPSLVDDRQATPPDGASSGGVPPPDEAD